MKTRSKQSGGATLASPATTPKPKRKRKRTRSRSRPPLCQPVIPPSYYSRFVSSAAKSNALIPNALSFPQKVLFLLTNLAYLYAAVSINPAPPSSPILCYQMRTFLLLTFLLSSTFHSCQCGLPPFRATIKLKLMTKLAKIDVCNAMFCCVVFGACTSPLTVVKELTWVLCLLIISIISKRKSQFTIYVLSHGLWHVCGGLMMVRLWNKFY